MITDNFLKQVTSAQIAEYMAYDALKDEEYRESLQMQMMSPEDQSAAIVKLLGG
jgi:hypothetical protein